MNKFVVKITYQDGKIEEKILEMDAISKMTSFIANSEDFEGKIPKKMTILQPFQY